MDDPIKYDVFIVDVYNLMYRSTFSSEERIIKLNTEVCHTEGIIIFLALVDFYLKKYGAGDDTTIYWLFDNSRTSIQKYRKSLNENYKKTRTEQPSWFYRQLDHLELILRNYRENASIFRASFLEADDYVTNLIQTYIPAGSKTLMISDDADWFRSLSDDVHQLKNKRIYNPEDFFEEYGFEATYSNLCFFKCFYGDISDNIKAALPYFPRVYFLDILKRYNHVSEFIRAVLENKLDYLDLGWIEKIRKEEELLLLNWNLIESADISALDMKTIEIKCKYQPNKLRIIYDSLDLIGRVDTKRIQPPHREVDILAELLKGDNNNASITAES